MLEVCNSMEDPYFYKAPQGTINSNLLLSELKPTVKTLDLSGHKEVNDSFIKDLSESKNSESLLNIDLSGTSVTEESLKYILGSKVLGTRRDLPQISGRYDMPAAEIYLKLNDNIDTSKFKRPADGFKLRYMRVDGLQTAPDATGIKMLNFNK